MLELFRAVFAPPRDLILVVAAAWAGLALADRRAKETGIGEKAMDSLVGVMVLGFIVGGRVFYAAEHLSAFTGSPASLLSLNVGLFDVWGGLAACAIAAAIVMQRGHLPAWQMLDLLSPFLAAVSVGVALSHIASGAAFGKETSVPWAINLWGAQRHPTQFYELMAAFVILGITWFHGTRISVPGKSFFAWLALTAGSRLVIEGFRGDSTLVFAGLRLAQVIAWIVLAGALIGLELLQGRETWTADTAPKDEPRVEPIPRDAPKSETQRAAPRKNSAP